MIYHFKIIFYLTSRQGDHASYFLAVVEYYSRNALESSRPEILANKPLDTRNAAIDVVYGDWMGRARRGG